MDSKSVLRGVVGFALAIGVIGQANAIPQLRLQSSAGANLLITDGDAFDANDGIGEVTFIGPIAGWSTNVTTGLSFPAIGSLLEPEIDLVSINASSTAGGWLNIWLTDTGFGPASNAAHVLSSIGGTTGGSVTFRTFYDTTNTAFGQQHELSSASFSPTGFSGDMAGSLQSATPYSLTILVTVMHTNRATTSFDALVRVPEPSSLLLIGAGLLAAGLMVRRRQTAVSAV